MRAVDAVDDGVLHHHALLDLRVLHQAVVVDGGEGPDVGVDDPRPLADYRRPADDAVHDFAAVLQDDASLHARRRVDAAGARRARGVSRIARLASRMSPILPVSIQPPLATSQRTSWPWSTRYWMVSVISSSPRADGLMLLTASKTVRVEQVDADDRQVRRRLLRLLDDAQQAAVAQLRHAEVLRVLDGVEQYLAGRQRVAAAELVDEGTMPSRRKLSPRKRTNGSSPRKPCAILTAWAMPSGASCSM